jgi:hypothetical protein
MGVDVVGGPGSRVVAVSAVPQRHARRLLVVRFGGRQQQVKARRSNGMRRPSGAAASQSIRLAYSFAAMKPTIFDSSCICRTILPTSSFGNLVSERRMR